MLSFFNNTDKESSILIDIGNGTITGSIVVFERNKKPLFVYIVRNFFSISEKLEAQKLEIEMNNLLEQTLESIMKKGFEGKYWQNNRKKINKVMISFSSPWFLSKTKTIEISNDKEFIITKNFLLDVLSKEIDIYKKELEVEHGWEYFEVVEKSIIHSKINGYVLDESVGKNTKNFNASLHISVVHNVFLDKVMDTVHKHTHLSKEKVHVNTFPLVTFSVLRDSFTKESDFMFMDITGEITDITLVKDDIIDKTVSIPSGKNFVVRQVAKNLSISTELAESAVKMFLNKKLDEQNTIKVSDILVATEKEWSIYLENALMELSPSLTLPSTLFLTIDKEYSDIYENFLKTPKMDQTNLFRKNLNLNRLDMNTLNSFYENQSGYILDEFIVILALFYKKIFSQDK